MTRGALVKLACAVDVNESLHAADFNRYCSDFSQSVDSELRRALDWWGASRLPVFLTAGVVGTTTFRIGKGGKISAVIQKAVAFDADQVLNPPRSPTISHFHQIPPHLATSSQITNHFLHPSISDVYVASTSTSQSQLLTPTHIHQNDWRRQVRRQGQRLQERAIVSLPCSVPLTALFLDASCRVFQPCSTRFNSC